ncbi:MAG: serine hydroxymethyltransferase [Candidatus Nomurabacteria bacterium]|jgi:glycine hydroxymethyltransferase|nr:serine hydroxymethyltransferase [Candidatus Nomurabacteria bacterium]
MDKEIFDLIKAEAVRQREGLELIPSENYVTRDVLDAMGSVLTNKYSEGYPDFEGLTDWPDEKIAAEKLPSKRYYGGQENTDRVERLAIARACRIFHADHANVQPHSGAQANNAVYNAWLEPGDTVLGMNLGHGGHLTHGSPVTLSAKIYNFIPYGTVKATGDIDYEEMEELAVKHQPKILLVGYSAFMKVPDFARVAEIGKKIPGCLLMADMAHVAGLIAGGVHANPFDFGFHVITTTTHKTLRGPRGGLILSRGTVGNPLRKPEKTLEHIPTLIDRSVFPGTQGGPLMHIIAAKAVAFREALQPEFRDYATNIVNNAAILADELDALDFHCIGGGTENHLILIDMMKSFKIDGKLMERGLDRIGLNLNANSVANDPLPPFRPSGIRLGTPAITTRGLGRQEMKRIAKWMRAVADICVKAKKEEFLDKYGTELEALHAEVVKLSLRFPLPSDK